VVDGSIIAFQWGDVSVSSFAFRPPRKKRVNDRNRYVAMHTMQGQAEQAESAGQNSSLKDTVAAVIGMLLPLVTQIGHHHH
jgi:hypothetical protein